MSQFFKILTSGDIPIPDDVPTQFTADDGNIAVPSAHNLNVFGDVGTATFVPVPGGDTIKIKVVSDSFLWSEKSTTFLAAIQNGYYCNAGLTVNLPPTAGLTIGNTIIIFVDTTSDVIIQANTGQSIQVGNEISAVAGTTTSNTQGSLLELNFKPSDSTWHTIANMGTWSTV